MKPPTIDSVFGKPGEPATRFIGGRAVAVEYRSSRPSQPGDPVRRGRADPAGPKAPAAVALYFELRADGRCYAMLHRAEVGVICAHHEGARAGFTWLCLLPEQRRSPQFAATADKARAALRHAVAAWCAAAGLGSIRYAPAGDGAVRSWREGES